MQVFSGFRLDTEKKFLWHGQEPVDLPPKAIELLCVLVGKDGEVVTKEEIWQHVWPDAYVEETNLTHNIYLLRKAFRQYGKENLIQTVPRRGYRFADEVSQIGNLVIERHSITPTRIEDVSDAAAGDVPRQRSAVSRQTTVVGFIAVCVMAALGGFAALRFRVPVGAPPIKSLAVLPFTTINAGSGDEIRGIGFADILITRLSGVKGVSIRPTSAVLNMKGSDIMADAQKLNVDAIIAGSIFRETDKVRVIARMIRTVDGTVLWSGEFEKLTVDELRLQNELALQIVNALALNLSDTESGVLAKNYTESPGAFELYVKGRYEWNKRDWRGAIEAQRLFRNAIAEDPEFALAHVGLADTLATNSATKDEALNAVQKALEIDPGLAEAHATIGFIKTFHHWKWDEAEASFKRSIEISPGYALAHHWYAELLAIQGRNDEALAAMHRALEINPLSYNFLADLGQKYFFAGDYVRAEAFCQQALEIYPDFNFAYWHLREIYLKQGHYKKALDAEYRAQLTNFLVDTPAPQKQRIEQDYLNRRRILSEAGGRVMLERSASNRGTRPEAAFDTAAIHALLGDKEKALDSLEIAFANRTFGMIFVKASPLFESLRSDSRYQEILRKMDLTD